MQREDIMTHSRFPTVAALAAFAVLATSTAALAANAVVTQDSYVYKSRSTSSAKVNFVEEDDEVTATKCQGSYCFLKIPGTDGWIRKTRLAPLDDEGDPHPEIPFSFGLTFGPGGPSVSIGIGSGAPGPAPGPSGGPRACFFQHAGYGGGSFCVATGDSIGNLNSIGWNDAISSIRLYGGAAVQACEHAGFGGACATWNSNKSDLTGIGWNDIISSVDVF